MKILRSRPAPCLSLPGWRGVGPDATACGVRACVRAGLARWGCATRCRALRRCRSARWWRMAGRSGLMQRTWRHWTRPTRCVRARACGHPQMANAPRCCWREAGAAVHLCTAATARHVPRARRRASALLCTPAWPTAPSTWCCECCGVDRGGHVPHLGHVHSRPLHATHAPSRPVRLTDAGSARSQLRSTTARGA